MVGNSPHIYSRVDEFNIFLILKYFSINEYDDLKHLNNSIITVDHM